MKVSEFEIVVPFEEIVRLVPELAKWLEELRDESKFEGIHRRPIQDVGFSKKEWLELDSDGVVVGSVVKWKVTLGFVGLDSRVSWPVKEYQLEGKVALFLEAVKWELAGWLHEESLNLMNEALSRWEDEVVG